MHHHSIQVVIISIIDFTKPQSHKYYYTVFKIYVFKMAIFISTYASIKHILKIKIAFTNVCQF